jgi:hypothetical protein
MVALAVGLMWSAAARADMPEGTFTWPGNLALSGGIGPGVRFGSVCSNGFCGSSSTAIAKFNLNLGYKLTEMEKISLWLGFEFNLNGRENYFFGEPGVFLRIGLEKLLHIPLVPFVEAGFSGGIDVFYGSGFNSTTTGDFFFKFGGGAYYFVMKMLGVGGAMHLALGGGGFGGGSSYFVGYWDFTAGAMFAF